MYAARESPTPALNTRPRTVRVEFVVGLCTLGREVSLPGDYYRAPDAASRALAARLFREVQPLVEDGTIVAHPFRIVGEGYDGVLDAIQRLRQGVSGERLVVLLG